MTKGENNQVKEVADRMRLPQPDVPVVKAMPEAVSLPGGPGSSETLRELWPRLSEAIENHFEERDHPSKPLNDGPKEEAKTNPEGNKATKLAESMPQTSLNRTDIPTPSQLEQAKERSAEKLARRSPFEQKGEKLQEKGTLAQRERAKRLRSPPSVNASLRQ